MTLYYIPGLKSSFSVGSDAEGFYIGENNDENKWKKEIKEEMLSSIGLYI